MSAQEEQAADEIECLTPVSWGKPVGRRLSLGESRLPPPLDEPGMEEGARRLTIGSRRSLESVQDKTETLLERSRTINLRPRFR